MWEDSMGRERGRIAWVESVGGYGRIVLEDIVGG
jgi:hypothetical protein